MKKYLLFIVLLLCNSICFFAQDEGDVSEGEIAENGFFDETVSRVPDARLFESALNYFSEYNGHNANCPESCEYKPMSDYVPYHNNVYSNGVPYQRIGRFSDEDYFDESCVNDVIASAPQVIRKIIINLLYPPKNKAALPKKLLLVGKPGTGKTTLAKAIALKCGYDYYLVEAPFLLNEYKNSGPQNLLREVYPLLAEGRKVVVILDELTELTDRYKKENDSDSTVASALWILLDSCAQCENIFFIGTSNKAKKDLPAQLQSRFDEDIVKIEMPHKDARKRILLHYLKDEKHAIDDTFLQYLVKKTDGRSAREIEKLVCKAIQFANLRTPRRYTITSKDFIKALALWKPLWHPVVIYEKIEPHIQPFFKTAFPIILQTLGLIHSIYASHRQQKNSDRALILQALSYLGQMEGLGMQGEGLGYQKEGLSYQKEGLDYQKEGLGCQKDSFEFQQKAHHDTMEQQKVSHEFQKQSHADNIKQQQCSYEFQQAAHHDTMDQQKSFHVETMNQQRKAQLESNSLQQKAHQESIRLQKAQIVLNASAQMSNHSKSESRDWS